MSLAARSWREHGRSPAAAASARHTRRGGFWRRRRLLLWLSPVTVLAAAAAVVSVLAASYQPLVPGGSGGGSFPGLRTGTGLRWLSAYGPDPALYVPPQRGTFGLSGSVSNDGSLPITIVAVYQPPGSPLTAAGSVVYLSAQDPHPLQPRVRVLRDVTLGSGQAIEVGMPLRIEYCADRRSYIAAPVFLVEERFFVFTRTVAIPFIEVDSPVVTNAPGGQPGVPGTFCGSR